MDTWERKLGIIVPSWNTVMEREIQRMAGESMSVHSMRIPHTADTEEKLLWLGTQAPAAAELLAHAKVNVICYGCAAGGFLKGPVEDRALGEKIAKDTGIPVAVSSAAVAEALRAFDAKRVSLASPYAPWLNERLRGYLTTAGFEVMAMQGLDTQNHSGVTNERIEALISEVDRPQTQAIFVSCSNFPTLAHHREDGAEARQADRGEQPGLDVEDAAPAGRQARGARRGAAVPRGLSARAFN